jgi:hypothetical protein
MIELDCIQSIKQFVDNKLVSPLYSVVFLSRSDLRLDDPSVLEHACPKRPVLFDDKEKAKVIERNSRGLAGLGSSLGCS